MNEKITKNLKVDFITKTPSESYNTLFYASPDEYNGFLVFVTYDLNYSKVLLFAINSTTSNLYDKVKIELIKDDYSYTKKGNQEIFDNGYNKFVLSTDVLEDKIKYTVSVVAK